MIDGQIFIQHSADGFSEGVQPFIARVVWPRGKRTTSQGFTAAAFCPISAVYRALRAHRAWCARIDRASERKVVAA